MVDLGGPGWALIGTITGAVISIVGTTINSRWVLMQQIRHDREMFVLQNKSAEEVKTTLLDMLNHRRFNKRSFGALKARVGGYSDDELRRLLHELSAEKSRGHDGVEMWSLPSNITTIDAII